MNETQQMEYTNTRTAYHTFFRNTLKSTVYILPRKESLYFTADKIQHFSFLLTLRNSCPIDIPQNRVGPLSATFGAAVCFVNISANILKPANILKLCHFSSLKAQEKNLESVCGQRFLANSSNLTKEVLDGTSV